MSWRTGMLAGHSLAGGRRIPARCGLTRSGLTRCGLTLCCATLGASVLAACTPAPPAATYYLSPSGSDSASGTSPSSAWRTLARATAANLPPGSRLRLQGGARFTGQLKFSQQDAGDASDLVRVTSYGKGKATIAATGKSGVVVYDTAGISVADLRIVTAGPPRPGTAGILLYSTLSGQPKLDTVRISNVDVSGFGIGVAVGAQHDTGFSHVMVTDARLHGNLDAGFTSYGPGPVGGKPVYPNSGLVVSHVVAYDNRGDPANTTSNSGSGIVVGGVSGASVTWSTAYGNGGHGGAEKEGPEGIWAYDARDVRIEHDVSYHNISAAQFDGGGFGFDEATFDSTMQYDLSYDNYGPGYLLYGLPAAGQSGNTARFNISSDDAQASGTVGSLQVLGLVRNANVYQNTIVLTHPGGKQHGVVRIGQGIKAVTIRNNVFVAGGGASVILGTAPLPPAEILLQGNDYYTAAGPWTIVWGNSVYSSLAAWRTASGQEKLDGKPGLAVSPGFTGSLSARPTPAQLGSAALFALAPGSPLRGAGLDLQRLFGIQPGGKTYAGGSASVTAPNIGAQ